MEEFSAAALAAGIEDGSQMSRFLLWVGNECFEHRAVSDFMVLTGMVKDLVKKFLAQDKTRRHEKPRTTHELKSWPAFFQPVWEGKKTFEIRRGEDRQYEVGDEVLLREYFAEEDLYGRTLRLKITYVLHGGLWMPADAWLFSFTVFPA